MSGMTKKAEHPKEPAGKKVTIIGIAGGTGSGKSTVVRKIVEALPPDYVAVVPLDSYYNDTSEMTEEERRAINFDHPDAFDWRLLHKQVHRLCEKGCPSSNPPTPICSAIVCQTLST